MFALRRNVAAAIALAPRTAITLRSASAVCTRYAATTNMNMNMSARMGRAYATTGIQVQSSQPEPEQLVTEADEHEHEHASSTVNTNDHEQRDAAPHTSNSDLEASPEHEFDTTTPTPAYQPTEEARIFIGNMPYDASEDDLRALLAECGDIMRVVPHVFPDTGRFRGSAHVVFASSKGAQAALGMDGAELNGRSLTIQKATASPSRERRNNNNNREGGREVREQRKSEPSATLFVGNLPYEFYEDDLRTMFDAFGPLKGARVAQDMSLGRSKGFAHVEFESVEKAQEALEALAGTTVAGRAVRLDFAGAMRERPEGSGRGERRQGGYGAREYGGERRGGQRGGQRGYGVRSRDGGEDEGGEERSYGRRREGGGGRSGSGGYGY